MKGGSVTKFDDLKIKEIVTVARYNTNLKSWRARDRKNHFIGIKLEGSALHDFGYKSFVLSRNHIYFFNQRDNYDVEVYEAGESFSVHFTTYEEIDSESFSLPIANTSDFVLALRKAEAAKNAGDEHSLLSCVYRLLAEIKQASGRVYAPRDERVTKVKNYIDNHLSDRDCLCRAIAEGGITARRLGDLFKSVIGVTPNRYLTIRRIERAKELLAIEEISVSEVAALTGFSDVYYFSKVFKAETGIPPSEWTVE